jgi:hypothetical protein
MRDDKWKVFGLKENRPIILEKTNVGLIDVGIKGDRDGTRFTRLVQSEGVQTAITDRTENKRRLSELSGVVRWGQNACVESSGFVNGIRLKHFEQIANQRTVGFF